MKTLFLFVLSLPGICAMAQVYLGDTLSINNYRAFFAANGAIAYNSNENLFQIPANTGVNALFAGNLWIGGYSANNNLYVSANEYNLRTNNVPGPVTRNKSMLYHQKYDRVWRVTKQQIQQHLLLVNTAGYAVPEAIFNWPAHGNVTAGEAANLAPFVDLNGNGRYEPLIGEYPDINGDEAVYIIYNDAAITDTAGIGAPMAVEVHLMAYGYLRNYDLPYVENTIYLSYKIYNRSARGYNDVLVGHWNDFDLGCFNNDRVGCDTVLNSFFVYNGVLPDLNCQSGEGYGNLKTSLGVKFLNHPMHAFGYFTNGAIPEAPPPNLPIDYYHYMDGFWRDGTPFTQGGTGYGSGPPTKYLLPGNPCSPNPSNWTDSTSGQPADDRRAVGSVGPFYLPAGGHVCVDVAYVFATSSLSGGCVADVVDTLKKYMPQAQERYDYFGLGCAESVAGIDDLLPVLAVNVYPNPASEVLNVQTPGIDKADLCLFDLAGRKIMQTQANAQTTTINLAGIAKGIYALQVKANGRSATKKIVIE